jgi:hypothetical protein
MADVIKVLGQIDAPASEEDLYIVPNLAQTTSSSLVICNRTAGTLTFRISVSPDSGDPVVATSDKDYLFYDTPLEANSTLAVVVGMTLAQNDVVRTFASGTGLSIGLFGVETTT